MSTSFSFYFSCIYRSTQSSCEFLTVKHQTMFSSGWFWNDVLLVILLPSARYSFLSGLYYKANNPCLCCLTCIYRRNIWVCAFEIRSKWHLRSVPWVAHAFAFLKDKEKCWWGTLKYMERPWSSDVGRPLLYKFDEIAGRNCIQIGQCSAQKRFLSGRELVDGKGDGQESCWSEKFTWELDCVGLVYKALTPSFRGSLWSQQGEAERSVKTNSGYLCLYDSWAHDLCMEKCLKFGGKNLGHHSIYS